MKQPRALKGSGYNCASTGYNDFVSQIGLLGDLMCPGCFMTLIPDVDDPDFLSCRHFPIEQQVFYILDPAAFLLLNNTSLYLVNEILSDLYIRKTVVPLIHYITCIINERIEERRP
jgi:hypothetical protein